MEYPTTTPEVAVGYMDWHLRSLKERGVEIGAMLDIGAAHGHFADYFLRIFPTAAITAIECNPDDEHYLKGKPYEVLFKCLGKEPGTATFYTNPNEPTGGGSSFYRENTYAFTEPVETTCTIETLDSLELGDYDFVKLDTQGSEVDIIDGGKKTIGAARFVLIECSFVPYNIGGCLIGDVVAKMAELGFVMLDTFGPARGGHVWRNQKIQADVLFVKKGDSLLNMLQ